MFRFWLSLRLHVQLLLASGLLLAITISLYTWFNIEAQKQVLVENVRHEAIALAGNLSITGSYLVITDRLDELESLLIQSISFPDISMLRIVSEEGKTLSHVKKLASGEFQPIYDLTLVELPTVAETAVSTDWTTRTMHLWQPIGAPNLLGWIEMDVSLTGVVELQEQAISDSIIGAFIAILLNLVVLFIILKISAKRFVKVVRFADHMHDNPGGQMDFRGGSFEINNLISALNISSSKLSIQREEIQRKSRGLVKLNDTLEQRVMSRTKALEEKNAELERFTYTASHDLKSPLVTISGFIGLLRKDVLTEDYDRVEKDLVRISDAVDIMQQLLDDLLQLSRIGSTTAMRVDICTNSVLDDVLKMLAGKINASQAVILVDPDLPAIRGDEARIKEVFLNLIENALKYSRKGVAPRVKVGVRLASDEALGPIYYVQDEGIGIAPQYREKIFGLFDRLNNSTEGTGVGLAIVKRIIEVHAGEVWVESTVPAPGSTFCFVITG